MMTLRKATFDDYESLRRLEQGVVNTERPMDDTIREDHVEYYDLGYLLGSEEAVVLVVEQEEEIIATGYAKIKPSEPFWKHERHAYLGFMFVKEEHRGRGINKMVLDGLLQWVKEQNVYEVKLEVYPSNKAAVRAYEKAGFTPHLLSMRMDIH